jgi:hypothetical protein
LHLLPPTALFDPGNGEDIVVPQGYPVSVFKSGLNFPIGIAFRGDAKNFEVHVLESGHGLPRVCNEQGSFGSGEFDPTNPFTPDILVFDQNGSLYKSSTGIGSPTGDRPRRRQARLIPCAPALATAL